MRILVLNWQDRCNPLAGGAEIHLHEVFGRLAARGHDVTALVSGWSGAPRRVQIDGIDVHRAGSRYGYLFAGPRYYRRRLRERPFDLIVEDLNKVPLFTPFWTNTPVVLLVHHLFGGTAFQELSPPLAATSWVLERPLARVYRDSPVQAVSRSTAADLVERGFRAERITVIPNGVDLEFYSPDPDVARFDEPTALYLGRLKRYKRVDLILRAFASVVGSGVDARLIIAGTGDADAELRRLARELGITDRVNLPGYVDEEWKRTLFRRTWVHVLTSTKEGWGISNLEAAACGTATTASDSPGLRDSVVHGETGFLVPHGDVSALSRSLARILTEPALRDRLGAAARRFALGFSWERAAGDTERHLLDVQAHRTGQGTSRRHAGRSGRARS